MNSPLLDKSLDFSTQIVLFYETFSKSKKDTTIAKQLLRSETRIRRKYLLAYFTETNKFNRV